MQQRPGWSPRVLPLILAGRYAEAEPLIKEEHARMVPGTQEEFYVALDLANCLAVLGQTDEAHVLASSVLARSKRVLGATHDVCLSATEMVATCLWNSDRLNHNALPLMRRVVEARERTLGADHVLTMGSTASLINCLRMSERIDEALEVSRALATRGVRVLGRDDRDALRYVNLFASCLSHSQLKPADQPAAALALFNVALEGRRRVLGPEHPDTIQTEHDLASFFVGVERFADAIQILERVLGVQQRVLGTEHWQTIRTIDSIGVALLKSGRPREGLPHLRIAVDAATRTLGLTHVSTLSYMQSAATCLFGVGRMGGEGSADRLREAADMWRRAASASRRSLGSEHWLTKAIGTDLANLTQTYAGTDIVLPLDRARAVVYAWRDADAAAARSAASTAWVDEWSAGLQQVGRGGGNRGRRSRRHHMRGGSSGGGLDGRGPAQAPSPRADNDERARSLPPLPAGLVAQPWVGAVIADNLGSEDCAICLDALGDVGVLVVQLGCRHTFCEICIRILLAETTTAAATCPECRAEI